MSKKALVLTRKTKLPTAMQKCVDVAGGAISPFITEAATVADLQGLISGEKPEYILIDGEYDPRDAARWKKLFKLDESALRLELLEADKADLPKSLELLKYAHAMKKDGVHICIFLEQPSDAAVKELGRQGAAFVFKNLNTVSSTQESIFQVIQGTKAIVSGVTGFIKALTTSAGKK